ncbi:MAG TPA: glycosyltransferase [Chthoniobacterales bacterium]|jgi:glycosyltransferase involved in cell wall biosynthesis
MTTTNPLPTNKLSSGSALHVISTDSKQSPASNAKTGRDYPIIVHSHLHWSWVWQRPQQFLSRLSATHPILFVEEPLFDASLTEAQVEVSQADKFPNITIVLPRLPEAWRHDRERIDLERRRALDEVLDGPLGEVFAEPVQWFYDPMAVGPFAGQVNEIANVYDCMDELAQFRGAPAELVRRERLLLELADVVFAGGPKIHSSKVKHNSNCHSYGCGVEIAHFGKARLAETQIPEDVAHIKGPILGFFGVVDERMDYDLIAKIADAHPDWQLVIIGPAIKVDPANFPQRENIHWMGGRDYQQLPAYVKAFDVCLMPFAINEATEFINPTKALEYMATGTPIVSTAIEDVVLQFSDVVAVANSHEEFISHCEKAVSAPSEKAIQLGLELTKINSWDAIVERLEQHIADVLESDEDEATYAA